MVWHSAVMRHTRESELTTQSVAEQQHGTYVMCFFKKFTVILAGSREQRDCDGLLGFKFQLTAQMPTMARAGSELKPRAQSSVQASTRVAGNQVLEPRRLPFQAQYWQVHNMVLTIICTFSDLFRCLVRHEFKKCAPQYGRLGPDVHMGTGLSPNCSIFHLIPSL